MRPPMTTAEVIRQCREALEQADRDCWKGYWQTRTFIDENVPGWVRGDDGPSYQLVQNASARFLALLAIDEWEELVKDSAMGAQSLTNTAVDVADTAAENARLKSELAEHEALLKLQHKRMVKATEIWRKANPGNELVMLDLGRLLEWLMDTAAERDHLREEVQSLSQKWLNKEAECNELLSIKAERDRLRVELEAAEEQIEYDRTVCADFITALDKALDGRFWLTEGRGSFAWDDARYRTEFHDAAKEVLSVILPMRKMAWSLKCTPTTTEAVHKARTDLKADLAAATARADAAEAKYRQLTKLCVATEERERSAILRAEAAEAAVVRLTLELDAERNSRNGKS